MTGNKSKDEVKEYKLKPYHIKVIWIFALRNGVINSQQTVTKGRVGQLAKKLGLTGKELILVDRKKELASQEQKTLELMFSKIKHKPTSLFEQQLEICKELALSKKVFKMPSSFSFNDAVEYAKKTKKFSELKVWEHGAGKNTLSNQKNSIWSVTDAK